jgi:uncharacterized protein
MSKAAVTARPDLVHPLLARVKEILRTRYGDRLEHLILYGSRARGDARSDSDWDIAVVLRSHDGSIDEAQDLVDVELDLLEETGQQVSFKVLSPEAVAARTIFMHHLREDGIDL